MISKYKWESLLLLGCFFWGISAVVNVFALRSFSPFCFCGLRFLIGSVILSLFFRKDFLKINKKIIKVSIALAVFLASAFIFEVFALKFITPVKVEFLVSLEIIIIPIIHFFMFKGNFTKTLISSIIVAFIGLLLINFNGVTFSFGVGELLALISAMFYSMQVITIGEYAKDYNSGLITILQLFFGSLICIFVALLFENINYHISNESIIALIISGIFCSGIAYYIGTVAQKNIPTVHAGIIYSTIPLFSIIASKVALDIVLSPIAYVGCFAIILSIINLKTNVFGRLLMKFKK